MTAGAGHGRRGGPRVAGRSAGAPGASCDAGPRSAEARQRKRGTLDNAVSRTLEPMPCPIRGRVQDA